MPYLQIEGFNAEDREDQDYYEWENPLYEGHRRGNIHWVATEFCIYFMFESSEKLKELLLKTIGGCRPKLNHVDEFVNNQWPKNLFDFDSMIFEKNKNLSKLPKEIYKFQGKKYKYFAGYYLQPSELEEFESELKSLKANLKKAIGKFSRKHKK